MTIHLFLEEAKEFFKGHREALSPVRQLYLAHGADLRFVGGCVRDSLLGVPFSDVDLASTLEAQQAMPLLKGAGYQVIPTGLSHGTITLVIHHIPYQITTCRHDAQTDGRRATVVPTFKWEVDAARRDFTFNALYLDFEGKIYDYATGLQDLEAGVVRFIGDPEERIREDYLRILRFFRFYARFGKIPPSLKLLEILGRNKDKLLSLSLERLTQEILELLSISTSFGTLELMNQCGILEELFPGKDIAYIGRLYQRELHHQVPSKPLRRLGALSVNPPFCRLSRAQQGYLKRLKEVMDYLKQHSLDRKRIIYLRELYGEAVIQDALLLEGSEETWEVFCEIMRSSLPHFPLKGDDILKMGVSPGPRFRSILEETRKWWTTQWPLPSRDECLDYIDKNLLKFNKN